MLEELLVIKNGGHADQLSMSTWGLDRYRIQSLEKIVTAEILDQVQEKMILETLIEKINLSIQGFQKHKKMGESENYMKKKTKHLIDLFPANTKRMNFVIALQAEALPLIKSLKLTKRTGKTPFPVFESHYHRLVISGIGEIRSAAATGYLLGLFTTQPEAIINLGLAGHGSLKKGISLLPIEFSKSLRKPFIIHRNSSTCPSRDPLCKPANHPASIIPNISDMTWKLMHFVQLPTSHAPVKSYNLSRLCPIIQATPLVTSIPKPPPISSRISLIIFTWQLKKSKTRKKSSHQSSKAQIN